MCAAPSRSPDPNIARARMRKPWISCPVVEQLTDEYPEEPSFPILKPFQEVQHHHSSQHVAAVMDRWPSFSRFGSRKHPDFHLYLHGLRQLTPAPTRRPMPTPFLEGVAAQFSLPNRLHLSAFIHFLLVEYLRFSKFLSLKKTDRVAPLLSLLPCWFVVITASETGVSIKTGIRDNSILRDVLTLFTCFLILLGYDRFRKLDESILKIYLRFRFQLRNNDDLIYSLRHPFLNLKSTYAARIS